jgi:ketosteroid isomerase-like protein
MADTVLDPGDVLATDHSFFDALLAADVDTLGNLLAEDFLIVDVMAGQVTGRNDLLDAIGSGEVQFVGIDRRDDDRSVRMRGATAVVVGQTRMALRAGGHDMTTDSRYTHVYIREQDRWLLLSAQGTPIVGS